MYVQIVSYFITDSTSMIHYNILKYMYLLIYIGPAISLISNYHTYDKVNYLNDNTFAFYRENMANLVAKLFKWS